MYLLHLFAVCLLTNPVVGFMVVGSRTRTTQSQRATGSLLFVMRDEYLQPHFHAPAGSVPMTDFRRMMECASSDGLCDVEEMERMINEIEAVNQRDSDSDNSDRDQVLKQALSLQLELQQTRQTLQTLQNDNSASNSSSDSKVHDHSFDHFVDYRSMGEFESH